MRCTPCHGTGVCNHEPCQDCGGYGQVSCCERFDPTPEASPDVRRPFTIGYDGWDTQTK